MKIIVGIIASHNKEYDDFKKIWIDNINHTLSQTNLEYKFYFIYGEKSKSTSDGNYNNIYFPYNETLRNVLYKTLDFMEYINNKYDNYILIRTNLSTLFDFKMYEEWLRNIPESKFFSGSLINAIHGYNTTFSGTNLTMTRDVVEFILKHRSRFTLTYNEDEEISLLVMANIKCKHKTIKRIDFIQDKIMFHRCKKFAENIFCFRFKSDNRYNDYKNMKMMLSCIKSKYNVNKFIRDNFYDYSIVEEGQVFEKFSEIVWSF